MSLKKKEEEITRPARSEKERRDQEFGNFVFVFSFFSFHRKN